jgi:hypothetical protein
LSAVIQQEQSRLTFEGLRQICGVKQHENALPASWLELIAHEHKEQYMGQTVTRLASPTLTQRSSQMSSQ